MPSDALPPRPSLDQLRRRAKELRDAARSGDPAALGRITVHAPAARAGTVTLAAAQLAIAREYGYPSWPRLAARGGLDAEILDQETAVECGRLNFGTLLTGPP